MDFATRNNGDSIVHQQVHEVLLCFQYLQLYFFYVRMLLSFVSSMRSRAKKLEAAILSTSQSVRALIAQKHEEELCSFINEDDY